MDKIIKRIIATKTAPEPIGPYSQAVVADKNVYVSGVIGVNLETGALVDGGAKEQAAAALVHLKNVLRASGSNLNNVVKTTVFLQDFNDFPVVNAVYKDVFVRNFPARSCVQVAKLPLGALVEIEAIAFLGEN
ncbi:rutC family protein UK114 [Contarinia nasturtii]|uniref:rutC family protein UK114 n=1 Tax=Contarinia nasturtii TaxID=265458 RepID=UPI0012D3A107|nr:rutC family protein UK114 [Contarinia nasturtii]